MGCGRSIYVFNETSPHGGEEAIDVSCLTKVHHGTEQFNWGEVAVQDE